MAAFTGPSRNHGIAPDFVGMSQIPVSLAPAGSCRRRVVRPRAGSGPRHAVGDRALDLRLVIDRKLLVTWTEVGNAAVAAVPAAAAAKDLPALERRDENELVRRRYVEELAVHL